MRKLRRLERSLVIALLASAWLGCQNFHVQTDYDTSIDFAAFKSYAWQPESGKITGDPRTHNSLVDSRVRSAVNQALAARNYAKATPETADFHVNYHVGIESKIDIMAVHDYHGYGYRGWYGSHSNETVVDQYEEGTLLLDILDPKSHELLWRGSARARISSRSNPEKREQKVRDAVQQILEHFPPMAAER